MHYRRAGTTNAQPFMEHGHYLIAPVMQKNRLTHLWRLSGIRTIICLVITALQY